MALKHWVGYKMVEGIGMIRQYFTFDGRPMSNVFPQYSGVTGPFRTQIGALADVNYGDNNPHLLCVNDAERIGKSYAKDLKSARLCNKDCMEIRCFPGNQENLKELVESCGLKIYAEFVGDGPDNGWPRDMVVLMVVVADRQKFQDTWNVGKVLSLASAVIKINMKDRKPSSNKGTIANVELSNG